MSHDDPTKDISQPAANKLATATWFLLRPYTWQHLAEMLRRRRAPGLAALEATADVAQRWGGPLAVAPAEALTRILGPGDYPSPVTLHSDVYSEGRRRADDTGMVLGGAANLELLYHLVLGLEARQVVETGVAYGWSSLTILLAQKQNGGGALASTDMPYPRAGNEAFVGCVVPDDLRASWTLIRRPDRPALPQALSRMSTLDLVHYDSDKTYAGQSWAFSLIWAALRPGGTLVADDIQYQQAFRDFVERVGVEPIIVDGDGKLIGIAQKPE